jgi:hypothetical protein
MTAASVIWATTNWGKENPAVKFNFAKMGVKPYSPAPIVKIAIACQCFIFFSLFSIIPIQFVILSYFAY